MLLQVGSGKITIERAEEITKINVVKLKNRIKHLKRKQKSKNKYENKKITNRRLIEAAFLEGWIILEKKIGADMCAGHDVRANGLSPSWADIDRSIS